MKLLKNIADLVPFVVAGGAGLAMLISVLHRYNHRFREFWETHICAFMEEHAGTRKDQ